MIKPIMEKIIVKQTVQETTSSGLIIPDSVVQDKRGVIVAVGDGDIVNGQVIPLKVAVGDEVVWFPFAGHGMIIEGQEYVVLRQSDIIGILPPKSLLTFN